MFVLNSVQCINGRVHAKDDCSVVVYSLSCGEYLNDFITYSKTEGSISAFSLYDESQVGFHITLKITLH